MFVTFTFLLSLIIKFLFIFRFSNDDWHHMWVLSWLSKKKKLDYESNNCLPNGYFAYPSLLLFSLVNLEVNTEK